MNAEYPRSDVKLRKASYPEQNSPWTSLGKFLRAVPEVWFDIIHVSADHVKGSVELREHTVEVALGPDGAFEHGNIGTLTCRVPADRSA